MGGCGWEFGYGGRIGGSLRRGGAGREDLLDHRGVYNTHWERWNEGYYLVSDFQCMH